MRILISGMWRATEPSGICRTILNLVRSLNEASPSAQVSLVIGTWQRDYFERQLGLHELKVDLVPLRISNTSLARNLWYLSGLPALARRLSADVLHCSMPVPLWKTRSMQPVIVTLHDMFPYDCPENFAARAPMNRVILRQALFACDQVICVSRFTLDRLNARFPEIAEKKTVLLPNVLRVSTQTSEIEATRSRPFVLAVAQHRRNKNLDLLLECVARCKAGGVLAQDTELVIVGARGPETPKLQRLVERLSLAHDVVFLSGLTDSVMTALYRDCRLFISLSDIEGFNLPLAEALLHGARVVASDIPVHRELAHDQCEFVDLQVGNRFQMVSSAVQRALSRPRPSRGRYADVTTKIHGDQLLKIYTNLIASRCRREVMRPEPHLRVVND